jgi:hypothetical protein
MMRLKQSRTRPLRIRRSVVRDLRNRIRFALVGLLILIGLHVVSMISFEHLRCLSLSTRRQHEVGSRRDCNSHLMPWSEFNLRISFMCDNTACFADLWFTPQLGEGRASGCVRVRRQPSKGHDPLVPDANIFGAVGWCAVYT